MDAAANRLARFLLAYLEADPDVDAPGVRDLARASLPEHMVPAAFVLMDAFPLTPTGKVDRRAKVPAGKGRLVRLRKDTGG